MNSVNDTKKIDDVQKKILISKINYYLLSKRVKRRRFINIDNIIIDGIVDQLHNTTKNSGDDKTKKKIY